MSYHLGTALGRPAHPPTLIAPVLGSFGDDAVKAMQDNPPYFAAWYTAKSIALVVAVATVTYLLGERKGRRDS